jgi:hypothetical protein
MTAIGGNANVGVLYVSSDPDGVLTAPRGTLAIDTTTGVTWKNQDGASRWEPTDIPEGAGFIAWDHVVGTQGLTFTNIAAGSSAYTPGLAGSPGIRRLTVTAAGADGVSTVAGANSVGTGILIGGGRIWSRFLFRIPTLSDGTNNIVVRIGLGDNLSAFGDHVDGVYIEYDFATYGDHRWRLCASSNSVRTKTDTGILAVADGTNVTSALIMVNAAGTSATARIGGVAAAAAVTTNIPTAAGRQTGTANVLVLKQLGAGALSFDVDGLGTKLLLTTPQAF